MRFIMITAVLISFFFFNLTLGEAFMIYMLTELVLIENHLKAIRQSLAAKADKKDNILLG